MIVKQFKTKVMKIQSYGKTYNTETGIFLGEYKTVFYNDITHKSRIERLYKVYQRRKKDGYFLHKTTYKYDSSGECFYSFESMFPVSEDYLKKYCPLKIISPQGQ